MSRAVVDAKEFSHAMSKISKILKKCAIPILEEVCLRIQNGRCTLTATDLETWLTAELPASGDDMFFVFRKTKDILRACSHFAGELTMEFSETQSGSKKVGRVLLRCERRGAEFEVYDGADYSHMKKAELVLKGYVSESSSTQLTSLNIAINGGLAMGHYWKGRLLLEQAKQDHDRCNDYKDAAIASFCATNVTERFDHLPENADEDAAPQLSPPQWLSAIELLRYPDRAVFRVDRRMVFQTIYQKLTQQVEEVQSDNIQIHNERYRLTKKDVRSNLERCLDMVKAQFPDKEPLIQKMIRSIR